jgi:hypothetical protein
LVYTEVCHENPRQSDVFSSPGATCWENKGSERQICVFVLMMIEKMMIVGLVRAT